MKKNDKSSLIGLLLMGAILIIFNTFFFETAQQESVQETETEIKNSDDVNKYIFYKNITDIYLFDSKGYEKSMSFKHSLLENQNFTKQVMLAGNIQVDDELENYKKIADIIDISGGVETSGIKDISKIEIFLNKIKQINDEA